jgi:uncharacterized protein YfaS (alpha-2-macroglobulin family)
VLHLLWHNIVYFIPEKSTGMRSLQSTLLVLFSCILSFTAKTQTKMISYDSAWQKIDKLLQQKGLVQSALSDVNNIYARAKKEKNDAQLIKALVYRLQLTALTTPEEDISGFSAIETEINDAAEPAKQVLQSIAAEMYWQFFQNNRWKLYGRPNTANFNKEDINTWTIDDLHLKISALYIASLQNPSLLQKTKLEQYEPLINKGNTRKLRPTVYDLLAHRALDYFENDEKDITRPAYAFTINEHAAFDPVADFIHHKFITKDTAALQFKALTIYQELLQFHSNDKDYAALIDADLRRLQFVYRTAVMPDKDELYRLSLQHITAQYEKVPAAAQAGYLLAQYWYNEAEGYDKSKNEKDKDAFNTAKNICEATISKLPGTEGAANCQYLLNNILRKSLTLHTEKVNIPGEAFRSLVQYKNIERCYFRIIKLDNSLKEQLQNRYEEGYWSKLAAQPAYRQWQQPLPAVDDHRDHSVEIKIDALPVGEYALLASITENFGIQNNLLAAQYFYISAISYVNRENAYFALHRNTGKPLAGAAVQVWTSDYDYTDRKNKLRKAELLKADKNGYFTINTHYNQNLRLEINWEKDHLFTDEYQYVYTRYAYNDDFDTDPEKENSRIYFFTDRSIYRPGQTVYFKGIGIAKSKDSGKPVIVTGKEVKVKLLDANMQPVDSSTLILSDYGSIHGSFHLPQQVLTGEFYITAEAFHESEVTFSVEEYKRPKFQVELEKPKGSFRINDTVSLTGFAKAYAGNSIDGAKVVYRVNRQARFIYPWLYYRRGLPRTTNMEIAHGTTTTDAAGKFDVQFPAIPDMSLDSSLQPVFDYTVQVDVTDINGETRSTTTTVPVGYASVSLTISLPQQPVPADSMKYLKIVAANLSGEPEALHTAISIFPLKIPQRLIRNRYWEAPDQFLYSESEFVKYFPHDEYKNESDYHNWEKGSSVYTDTMTAKGDSKHLIENTVFHPGWYMIEATAKDKYGAEVKAVSYVQLYDPGAATIPSPSYNWQAAVKTIVEPGGTADFYAGSSADNLFIIQETSRLMNEQPVPLRMSDTGSKNRQTTTFDFSSLSNEKKSFQVPVAASDRGGFEISRFFVKDNRFYTNNIVVDVPWTNKELSVSFTTFRDKTEPGSKEKWEVKISGKKGEKVAAEMLASMYDASLDQFKPHTWSLPRIWPQYYDYSYWNDKYSFTQVTSQERNTIIEKSLAFEKKYDRLITAPAQRREMLRFAAAGAVRKEAEGTDLTKAKRIAFASSNSAPDDEVKQSANMPAPPPAPQPTEAHADQPSPVRTNFNETAFFFPDLKTDSAGNISFSFTMPEALTQWKLMAFAHTPELAMGYAQQTTVTQKELMVQPNPPRFLREKDSMSFSAKVVNMGDKLINGFAKLELFDAATNQPVDALFQHAIPAKSFAAAPGQSVAIQFPIHIPADFNAVVLYRISASSSEQVNGKVLADGEENVLPVLSNRMLLTESLPLNMKGTGSKKFTFEKLLHSPAGKNSTLKNYGLTVEYTANPVWYAVRSLPYLTEFPYECAEQTFNRYYANMLATGIANSSPRLKSIFDKWSTDTAKNRRLVSALEKNEALKSILLQETPWLTQAKNETERMKQIAALFDMVRMSSEAGANLQKLEDLQTSNGGFVWFKGGSDDRYITQYILTGVGHLNQLGLLSAENKAAWEDVTSKALSYCDKRLSEEYSQLVRSKAELGKNNLSRLTIQYLYMRSFFNTITNAEKAAFNYYMLQAKKYWLQQDKYMQGMIALALFRSADKTTAKAIVASLKENAVTSGETGMYWKNQQPGYYWYEAPIEQQALLIEAFSEIGNDKASVNAMKLWLLQQKQTQHWGSTKATAEACYALLLQGSDWLSATPQAKINIGNKVFTSGAGDEVGTGYFQQRIDGAEITPDLGNITITVSSKEKAQQDVPGWGAVYWQYFEDIDKITAADDAKMPLQLHKQLFVEKNTDKGPVLYPVTDSNKLQVGDKLKVRIELKADRDMEYVHMKDLRAAGTEPVNVLSTYKWQGGLGYYESTKDASTNFFFSRLPKGTYVFEYPLWVAQSGNFSAGAATIQCMYAPEYISHSEGIRITVE